MSDNSELKKNRKVVIAGGGTAGWMAAAALSKQLGNILDIVLVESDEISTVGVGEATIPPIRVFHKLLGIDEQVFMRATNATFKLGISFENWGKCNDQYMHSFGKTGKESFLADFQHFWLHGQKHGFSGEFGDYCYELQAAKAGKFKTSAKSAINFAYHMDATLYAKFLRGFCEEKGVKRIEGKIVKVHLNDQSGEIKSLTLDSNLVIEGDLFIDCTGFKGLLIEQTLHTGYEDWSHWLPCDSAVVAQTESTGPVMPYTRSIAHDAGWRWRIPLQNRVGNGLVYCSRYLSDDDAISRLTTEVEGKMLTEPKVIKFRTGRRRKAWNKNCVSLGLASGFVEPLESTSINLIITGIIRLIRLFPFDGIQPSLVDEYNNQTLVELEKIRDFIVLHYHVTERQDSPFWQYCKNMEIPATLAHRIKLFTERAHAFQSDGELFRVDSWTQVMLGQGVKPKHYHHVVKMMGDNELSRFLNGYRAQIAKEVEMLPNHQDFIDQYCKI
jgi:tryptophan halogenase